MECYFDDMNENYEKAVMSLVDDILNVRHRQSYRLPPYTCPECEQTFTDPDEYAYGHDCEG